MEVVLGEKWGQLLRECVGMTLGECQDNFGSNLKWENVGVGKDLGC